MLSFVVYKFKVKKSLLQELQHKFKSSKSYCIIGPKIKKSKWSTKRNSFNTF